MNKQKQTPLEAELKEVIAHEGPITMAQYMASALSHPKHGYYMSRDPFGTRGDFITAPEISQIFGELIGVWCSIGFQIMGAPKKFALVELGPGRGTLMSDLLAAARVMAGFMDGVQVHLVETSPLLIQNQKAKLCDANVPVDWHRTIESVPRLPMILVANEFFDALPVRQFQLAEDGWRERVVGLDGGKLKIGLGESVAAPAFVAGKAPVGTIVEVSAARGELARALGARIAAHGGCGLIIDYGHVKSAAGDSLQAISKHGYVDVLERPGLCDITSHVDFEALAGAFNAGGAKTWGPLPQGHFLNAMGLQVRAKKLRKNATQKQVRLIDSAVERLAGRSQMGELFKVMALTHPGSPTPEPFGGLST